MFMSDSPVAMVVLAVCAIVFILINSASLDRRTQTQRAIRFGCYDRDRIRSGEWWRMLTVGFTHIQPWHVAMNLYALYNLSSLESYFGHVWFAVILFGSVLGGSIMEYMISDTRLSVGLSGGLYGLMTAYIILVIHYHLNFRSILLTLGMNLVINFMPGIAWQAHLGGALTGLVLTEIYLWMPELSSFTGRMSLGLPGLF